MARGDGAYAHFGRNMRLMIMRTSGADTDPQQQHIVDRVRTWRFI